MAVIRDPLRGARTPQPSHSDEQIAAVIAASLAGQQVGAASAQTASAAHRQSWTVLTGAGMSTDSGIPDYRGPNSPQRTPMSFQTFLSHPRQRARYWARSWVGYPRMRQARPNRGHALLARLGLGPLITQNVDGLHTAAGSRSVIELHGSLDRVICLQCGRVFARAWLQEEMTALNPGFGEQLEVELADIETAPDGDVELDETAGFRYPDCPICHGILKPDVVYFGESVPRDRVDAATAAVAAGAGLLVAGTSLAVHSGLRFLKQAAEDGKPTVIVTDGPTRGDDLADYRSTSRVAEFLETLRTAVEDSFSEKIARHSPASVDAVAGQTAD
ncbi:Sir2 family NAD-dependent protein deacetylase [Brevibacterium otitidis]|uniref:protein acetyllysine N-acetyltransferase n=1 Tax=Brevibacterium otitidis TaxID=53364 RepID=A0ABV5WZ12_9MICO|nr:NAD-dependent protein deacetylase [Brevibacterium otitidis]